MTSTALVIAKGAAPHPPLLTIAVMLAKTGRRVTFAPSACDAATQKYLESHGVTVCELQPGQSNPSGLTTKLSYWWEFRRKAWDIVQRTNPDLLWIATADSALAMGRDLLKRPYVLQLHELYDSFPYYRRNLKDYAIRAQAVVVPEHNRACILRSWYGLTRTPFVLPNKPIEHPRQRRLPITNPIAREALSQIDPETRIVLYQGIIHRDRDLRPVGQAVEALGSGWRFVVAGRDEGFLGPLRAAAPQLLHIPYVPPPYHLEVTSHATIGVLAYCFDNLNNVFCAPNKTWEYSGFGLPMLGNDVPGLKLLEEHRAGLCVDFQNATAVREAIRTLAHDQEQFAANSAALYDRFELADIVDEIAAAA